MEKKKGVIENDGCLPSCGSRGNRRSDTINILIKWGAQPPISSFIYKVFEVFGSWFPINV